MMTKEQLLELAKEIRETGECYNQYESFTIMIELWKFEGLMYELVYEDGELYKVTEKSTRGMLNSMHL